MVDVAINPLTLPPPLGLLKRLYGGKMTDSLRLPIDVISGTDPPRFRWRQRVDSVVGVASQECEGTLPASVEQAVKELVDSVKKLQAFKGWVHAYLDGHGVPHHPPGTHGAEGCRIGDRLDWLMDKLKRACEAAQGTPQPTTPIPKGRAR